MESDRDEKDGADVLVRDERADLINVSGHVQELDRSFGLLSTISLAVICDNAWAAGGGTLVLALYNGGGPSVMYGLIATTFFYGLISASLAELASAIPSSANMYHWASVTPGPRYGRICSWYAGWWNFLAWIFGSCVVSLVVANAIIAMYTLYHPDFVAARWQLFIVYFVVIWGESAFILYGQRFLAKASTVFAVICLACFLVTTIVLAVGPSRTGYGYASNAFVWSDWQNLTGWTSNGFVFLAGMVNGAYAIGTPDSVTHMAEEVPNPRRNVPRGIVAQLTIGFLTTFIYYIAILYGVTSLDDVFNSNLVSLPLAAMYQQAVRSNAATFGLLFVYLLDSVVTIPGAWVAASRMLWTLARDDATPFSDFISKISPQHRNPFNAQLVCSALGTVLGLIYIGSQTAFNAFVGAFTTFTTMSYLAAILPHILTSRKNVKPGPFWMPAAWAYPVTGTACAYIIVFNVIYMFPYAMPFDIAVMNWNCVIVGGFTIVLTAWYFWKRNHGYVGPQVQMDAHDDVMTGHVGLDKRPKDRRKEVVVGHE